MKLFLEKLQAAYPTVTFLEKKYDLYWSFVDSSLSCSFECGDIGKKDNAILTQILKMLDVNSLFISRMSSVRDGSNFLVKMDFIFQVIVLSPKLKKLLIGDFKQDARVQTKTCFNFFRNCSKKGEKKSAELSFKI